MLENIFGNYLPKKVLSYEEYIKEFVNEIETADSSKMDQVELDHHNYRVINLQRTNRIAKTYKPSEELLEAVQNIKSNQTWIAITESWCGDSAQTLPYINKFVSANDKINFRFIYRDQNFDFADSVIKEGNPRSIPRVIAFDENGNQLFTWGARPKEAQAVVDKAKSEGKSKEEFNNDLHLWYGRNRGKAIESEFIELISKLNS